jgi:tRNA(Ile)-lysidine synthase
MVVDLEGQVRAFLKPRLAPGARLCLGYSGGLDSSVLLHCLAGLAPELGYALSALHVHHGLSVNADAWAGHCRLACERLGVPLAVRRVAVVAGDLGLEAAARAARYRAYRDQAADFIVLAHHLDDQAETLLFRLLRGAGVHGLAAMAEQRGDAGGAILRPLLATARADLAAYARAHGIAHVEDESNTDTDLARNWLRREVMPVLAGRFPATPRVLARTAEQLAESAELLDQLAAADLARVETAAGLAWAEMARLGPARARNLLRHWLHRETGALPGRAWLVEALAQLTEAGPDRHPALAVAGRVLRRQGDSLVLAEAVAVPTGAWRWRGEPELVLGEHGRLRFRATLGEGLAAACLPGEGARVAWRGGGERLRPDCRRPARTLKNLLREASVPAGERGRLPLLWIGDRLAWAAGIGIECACQAGPGQPGWLISWCPAGR